MKKILFISSLVLICGLSVFGQTTKADLEQLRKQVGLPTSQTIGKNDASFPTSKPIKIYLAIKHNKQSAQDFMDWVDKWNDANAAQFGEMQIVDRLNDADIAAVQYQFGTGRVVRGESVKLKTGKIPGGNVGDAIGGGNDKLVLNSVGNSKVKVEDSVKTLTVPLYSYLMVRGQNSVWSVNYSRVDDRISDNNFPELLLQSAIEDKLKNR